MSTAVDKQGFIDEHWVLTGFKVNFIRNKKTPKIGS